MRRIFEWKIYYFSRTDDVFIFCIDEPRAENMHLIDGAEAYFALIQEKMGFQNVLTTHYVFLRFSHALSLEGMTLVSAFITHPYCCKGADFLSAGPLTYNAE
ncbi:hypothetical protein [Bartonella harrusi]|uniref:Uncharacterized protein n=2 Tax=Bartonella harrusi TaxID=2961895 RepID=A0ABY5ERT0_9HYPH|nr:hypothetical protein [Bartonella harrusi]UTO28097.1 hypothetical protein NMK50_07815 [Bartonella harrusi]